MTKNEKIFAEFKPKYVEAYTIVNSRVCPLLYYEKGWVHIVGQVTDIPTKIRMAEFVTFTNRLLERLESFTKKAKSKNKQLSKVDTRRFEKFVAQIKIEMFEIKPDYKYLRKRIDKISNIVDKLKPEETNVKD